MLQLLRVRRGRKAAVAALAPHVEASRHRLDGIPDGVWLEPYMVGFMSMLITLVAGRAANPLGQQAMGLVQIGAWAEITGMKPELVGEEICLLSSNSDGAFAAGCRNAAVFLDAYYGESLAGEIANWARTGAEEPNIDRLHAGSDPAALWAHFFDTRIARMDYAGITNG